MAALWLNQYHPRNKTRPWLAIASRGNRNSPRTVLQSTATKIVIKLMNWNQYRVGTLLHRVHTDCLGRKFSPQRSQYTDALRTGRDSNQRSPSAYCVCRSKNYWSEGQFWSRSFSFTKVLSARAERTAAFRRSPGHRLTHLSVHRNQDAGAPALRPSSCSSSSCFCTSTLRFSKSFNWPFLSLMYAMLSFIPVVTSKPPFPYFLMSSFILAMASSAAAIWPRISCARPRQYSSLFSPPSPLGSAVRSRCVPFLGASPTTHTPGPFIPDKSSSVYTLPFAAVGFFALALRAASASESSFCGGWPGVAG